MEGCSAFFTRTIEIVKVITFRVNGLFLFTNYVESDHGPKICDSIDMVCYFF